MAFKPKFISFDCCGTLINFEMGPTAKRLFEDRVRADRMPAFLAFRAYRLDEVLGAWKPFFDGIENSIQRACMAHGVEYRASDAIALYGAIS
jgi:2-haloacid dehalogenase